MVVVCGETGSGKSTQLPKLCLEAGLGRARAIHTSGKVGPSRRGLIGHTQPRRLAARSIAARIAEELGTTGDTRVAYKIRFGDQTSPQTLIKLMTDGILLAETQSDRQLRAYDAIIIDEAHERSLNIDFLLGYFRGVLDRRPEFRLIITSATIDAGRFAEHFGVDQKPAPIIQVEGRGFPVDVRYLPWDEISPGALEEGDDYDLSRHVIAGIDAVCREGSGDILVFLPTERDIREVSHHTAGHFKRLGLSGRTDVLPLYARLPQAEQQRIFHPSGEKRRIIFATNVAESSLTVPNIRYVVDSGTARISRYSPRSKVQRLPIEPVSRASCDQRSGRCGRVAPGICVRLYSRDDYESRDAFTTPEIRRTNLASVILQTKVLQLGAIEKFPFLDPPRPEAVREGYRTLREIGALDADDELTKIGRALGRMPVDPRVGRMILAADDNGVLAEVLVIAAAIEAQDPRDRPPDKRQAADESHAVFQHPKSDFLSYLKLWRFYQERREELSRGRLEKMCRSHFLSPQRMREWGDVHRQLRELALAQGRGKAAPRIRYAEDDQEVVDDQRYALIHQSLLTGLLFGVAMAGDKNEYTGGGGLKLFLWPGSGVFGGKPKWIVAAELVETTKPYARTVAAIQPQWLERIAEHLVKRNFSDPHWSSKAGGAFCYEQVSLFGLPIVTRRRVPLAPIDRVTARDLLIDEGLVNEQMSTTARAVRFNRELLAGFAALAAKTRLRDYVVDPYAVRNFYASRLPDFVCDRVSLEKHDRQQSVAPWSKTLEGVDSIADWLSDPPPRQSESEDAWPTLFMRPDDLVNVQEVAFTRQAFPDELVIGDTRLPLEYRFEPGGERDGVSVTVHRAALAQLSDDRLGWLVPGLLEAKLIALIKSLPKRIRRNLVPAADVARSIAEELSPRFGIVPFLPAVCEAMSRRAEMPVTPNDFTDDKLDSHLEVLVKVVDDVGEVLAESRGADDVRRALGSDPQVIPSATPEAHDAVWWRERMKSFEVVELPAQVVRTRGGVQVAQFPALVDGGDHVSTRLFADASSAEAATRRALTRLFSIELRKDLRAQVRHLPGLAGAKVRLASILPVGEIEDSLADLIARRAFVENEPITRTQEMFGRLRDERSRRIAMATQEVAIWLPALVDGYHSARGSWESLGGGKYSQAIGDVREQVRWLGFPGFACVAPWAWLRHYPRYFQSIAYRLDKLRSGAGERDDQSRVLVAGLWNRWIATLAESHRNPESTADVEFRWMIEELRVSLFAQPLGTSVKVSPQRCEKMIQS